MKFIAIFIMILLLSTGCKQKSDAAYTSEIIPSNTTALNGKLLMEQKCYVCHSPSKSMQDRLAPPMIAVKKHYITEGITNKEFALELWKWVENPSKENSKMKGAINRFGIMPKQSFKKEDITAIAYYLYGNEIEQPEWIEEHMGKMRGRKRMN